MGRIYPRGELVTVGTRQRRDVNELVGCGTVYHIGE